MKDGVIMSFEPEDFVLLSSLESCCEYGVFAVQIRVASSVELDFKEERIFNAASDARDDMFQELAASAVRRDPKSKERSNKERRDILALFDEPIFVEEIPNGYCSSWCCRHLPWFIVTTKIGRFKVGCRKRVIQIDWSECPRTCRAEALFPDEDVTKSDRMIHAWSFERAREYIQKIVKSVQETKSGE